MVQNFMALFDGKFLLQIFVNTGPYGAGNIKPLHLLQFSSNVNQTSGGP